jgi:hypothetical protein
VDTLRRPLLPRRAQGGQLSGPAHVAGVEIAVPAAQAYAYLADGLKQGEWALGSWNRRPAGDGIFAGNSLFDGRELLIRLVAIPELMLVEYHVGRSADALAPLVWGRVVAGPVVGLDEDHCVLTLVVWRSAGDSEEAWELLGHTFPTEVQMIKGRLELGF